MFKSFYGFFLVWLHLLVVSGQSCLQAAGERIPPFFDDNSNAVLPSGTQAIVTSYKFKCCVNITKWETFVQPGGSRHANGVYQIIFQVWRPSPTVDQNGCYTDVGHNTFTGMLQEGGKVELTVEPSSYITAYPGDVVGLFVISEIGGGIQLESNQAMNTVWYHTTSESNILIQVSNMCKFPVGTAGTLQNFTAAAPILQVSTSGMCPTEITPTSSANLPSSTHSTPSSESNAAPSMSTTPNVSEFKATSSISTSSSIMTLPPVSGTTEQPKENSYSTVTFSTEALPGPTSVMQDRSAVSIIVIGVSIAVVVVTGLLMGVLIIGIVLWKKKNRKCTKSNSSVDGLDLANPNYDSSIVLSSQSSQSQTTASKKQEILPSKPPNRIPSLSIGNYDFGATYESLECEETPQYSYRMPSPTEEGNGSSFNNYTYITVETPVDKRSSKNYVYTLEEDLYHVIGPDTGQHPGKPSNHVSPPPVPKRNEDRTFKYGGFYHILEGTLANPTTMANPAAQYEDPTSTNIRIQDSSMKRMTFETTGYYVPTEEERSENGHAYEHAYEQECGYKPVNGSKSLNFFVEDQIYWAPAATASALYAQLSSKRYREIPRNQIRLKELLGAGQFGEVCKAVWRVESHELELAVKTLKAGASEEDKVKFLQEAAIMGQFSHTNVIKMYGVVTLGEPVLICSEILANGDLRSYLQGLNLSGTNHSDFMEAQLMFLKFARDIAAGLEYLSQKSFVHRDLAARNILLNKFLTCKVADFGMARDLMDDTYYKSSGGKIPVKWTAPEALLYKKYSTHSDVWSYSMVLFEIWSVAKKPFSNITNNQVLRLIQTGYCQPPPPGCPRAIYKLMVDCWNPDHQLRPTFSEVCQKYLKQSSAMLLYWTPQDEGVSPAVGVCGAPLQEAEKLHLDLQMKYKNYRML